MESANNSNFPYFPLFPPEIREMVWEACLPTRVVEIDLPVAEPQLSEIIPDELDDDENETYCTWKHTQPEQWYAYVKCSPVISRVCRESRAVALRDGRPWNRYPFGPFKLLDPVRDVVHVNWNPSIFDWIATSSFSDLASAVRSEASRVSITYDLVHLCGHNWELREEDRGEGSITDLLETRSSYELCLGTVIIHVTGAKQEKRDKIIKSELFGLFGEKSVELVATTDHPRLQRFADFNAAHGSPNDVRASYFFANYQTDDIQKHMQEVDERWLKYCWEKAEKKGMAIEDRDLAWGVSPYNPDQLDFSAPNREHPWVRGVLDAMPRFRPSYMVRVCLDDCT